MSVQAAADEVINKKLKVVGGEGGVIVLDAKGNFAMPFNSEGMYRGWVGTDDEPHVKIYRYVNLASPMRTLFAVVILTRPTYI